MTNLSERQQRFVDFFIQTANASEAARLAGYTKKNSNRIGTRLLSNVHISATIKERLEKMASKRIADTEEVLMHLTAVLRGEVKETVITPSGKKFVVPVRESDKLKAAENLLKVFGAYKDKLDVKVDGAQLFVDTLTKISAKLETDTAL